MSRVSLLSLFHVEHLDTIGSRIRAARRALYERTGTDLSQVALSRLVGLTKGAVNNYEAGSSTPDVAMVERLAGVLGVTPGWLAFGQEPRYPSTGSEAGLKKTVSRKVDPEKEKPTSKTGRRRA